MHLPASSPPWRPLRLPASPPWRLLRQVCMDMYTSDDDVDKGEAIEMLVEAAVQRGAEHIRTPAACLARAQSPSPDQHAGVGWRVSFLHSTDQTTCDEIMASVNACFTAASTPSAPL